jgi:hypothetical protein
MAFIIFFNGINNSPQMMHISFGIAIYIFMLLEIIRQELHN